MIDTTTSGTELLLWLLGGIALMLWGMRMVRTGVQRAFGGDLRHALGRLLRNRFQAALAGLGITLLLQSSMATCLLVGSFAGRGLLPLAIALAIMLGADVGTSLVAQLFTFDLSPAIPVLFIIGVVMFLSSQRRDIRSIGRSVLGLGLLLLALKIIVGAAAPLRDVPAAQSLLLALAGEPVLAILIAALIAWAMHSSLATILMLASLAGAGAVGAGAVGGDGAVSGAPPAILLLALVLGANLGGALAPCFAGVGETLAMRRVAIGNLCFKLIGVVVVLALSSVFLDHVAILYEDPARAVVNLHTAFNLLLAVTFLPLVGPAAQALEKLRRDPVDEGTVFEGQDCLEESDLETPKLALANASREVLAMTSVLDTMLELSRDGLFRRDPSVLARFSELDDRLDDTHENVKLYLTRLRAVPLEDDESRRSTEILAYIANLEHAGDIVDKTLSDVIAKMTKRGVRFSSDGQDELDALSARVRRNLQLSMNVFITSDVALARRLLSEKESFGALEREAIENHYDRLRRGTVETIETSALHLDVLRDLKRINSHLCSAAYPILAEAGVLRGSRMKKVKNGAATANPDAAPNNEPPCVPNSV